MTLEANLLTRRAAIGTELAALTRSADAAYKDGLYRELAEIDKLLTTTASDGDAVTNATSFEIETRGVT